MRPAVYRACRNDERCMADALAIVTDLATPCLYKMPEFLPISPECGTELAGLRL